jgi:murein DD-endopeptidase MepM/ murein hydrolase activator NlpD
MDEKTVIARRPGSTAKAASEPAQPAAQNSPPAENQPVDDNNVTVIASVLAAGEPKPAEATKTATKASSGRTTTAKTGVKTPVAAPQAKPKRSILPIFLALMAVLLVGLASAITSIFIFSRDQVELHAEVTDADLEQTMVPVTSEDSEAEDEALVRAAIKPRVIDLSGDPVMVRRLTNAPRQLVKLDSEPQRKAADDLGIKADVYRFREVLDLQESEAQVGVAGSQDDIATAQAAASPASGGSPDAGVVQDGSSVVVASDTTVAGALTEFAQTAGAPVDISKALGDLGLDGDRALAAQDAFNAYYGRLSLEAGDRYAVRAVAFNGVSGRPTPVQLSVYAETSLVGSIALNDVGAYAKSEDPWYERDPFETQLVPESVNPENRLRLLDAIYLAALRNRVPAPVVGETIMLLSRAQDLEQKVQAGDTVTIVYTPAARDEKQGLGRIVFVRIGRTGGNLDCYVMQGGPNGQFECVSQAGAGSLPSGGMVTPVNGVIVARFGPQGDDPAKAEMNYGVDWTAPAGTPVVAAFAGQIASVGPETGSGVVVRITHPDSKTTIYTYLQRSEPGLTVGATVAAGQVIGYVGVPPTSREPRLHFELRRNEVPVDPIADSGGGGSFIESVTEVIQTTLGGNNAVDVFVHRIIYIESGNNCKAKNPLSSASGLGQFIDSTWMTTIRLHRPDLLVGRTRGQVLAMRFDCTLARAMTTAFTRDNAAVLRSAGHNVTPGNLYLAHFLGVGGAKRVLGGRQDLLISEVFGEAHVRANPFERGKSLAWLVNWAAKKMGGKTPRVPPSSKPAATPSPAQIAKNDSAAPAAAPAAKPGAKPAASSNSTQSADRGGAPAGKPAPKAPAGAAPTASGAEAPAAADPNAPADGAAPQGVPNSDPLTKFAADPAFAKLKQSVLAMLE